jgi:hypothetical protein
MLMTRIIKLYRLLNILSVDVALGSICSAAWFAELFNVNLLPYAFVSLGITVWIIYTVDHLLDARKIVGTPSTERHRFHKKYFRALFIAVVTGGLIDIFVVFFIRKPVFQAGIVLASIMVMYFLLQRFLKHFKEFVIAFLFGCGVLLPSWSLTPSFPGLELSLIIVQFIITALINLLLFSWFDRNRDNDDKRASFVTMAGEKVTRMSIWFLFLTNGVLMTLSTVHPWQSVNSVFIILLMNASLLLLFVRPKVFEVNDRYRLLGDAIFYLPCLYLVW